MKERGRRVLVVVLSVISYAGLLLIFGVLYSTIKAYVIGIPINKGFVSNFFLYALIILLALIFIIKKIKKK